MFLANCLITTVQLSVSLGFIFQAGESNRNQSSDRDHRGTKSKERERSWEEELPSAEGHAVARDRAIQRKRREIDEVKECHYANTLTLAEGLAINTQEWER